MPATIYHLNDHASLRPASMDELIAAARDIASSHDIPPADRDYQADVLMRLERSTYLARLCGAAVAFDTNPMAEVIELSKYLDD